MITEIPCKPNHKLIGFEEKSGAYIPIFKRVLPIGTLVRYKSSGKIHCNSPIKFIEFKLEDTALVISDELMITYDGVLEELNGKSFTPNIYLSEFLTHLKEQNVYWDGQKLYVPNEYPKHIKQFCEGEYTLENLENLILAKS
jgi:aspartyl/asparaginyl-tRNA synthetase